MSQLKILVVGASIAGPTTAYWLARAGASVTVIERFPKMRTSGQAIDVRTCGVTVMRKMPGMEAAVRERRTTIEGLSFVRDNGKPYGILRSTGDPDQQNLISEFEIFRGDLAGIIYGMTRENKNIKYVFGEQVSSIEQNEKTDGPVTVTFANGYPASKYDLVVACDGSTSRTRSIGLGRGMRDYIEPVNTWAAYFTVQKDLLEGSKIGTAHSAVGGRFVALGPDPTPGVNRVALFGVHPRGDRDATKPFRDAAKAGNGALKTYLADHFKGVGWKTDEILRHMMDSDSDDFYGSEIVQVKPPHIYDYSRRFVMVGDAGYAPGPTGGGTSLALAGAYILSGEISSHGNDLRAALQGYEERMRPIIKELQKIPPFVPTLMAPQTAWELWLRNAIFWFLTNSGIVNFAQRHFGGATAHVDTYKIPHYEWKV